MVRSAGPVTLTITNQRGLHARASARLVTVASGFQSVITVSRDGNEVVGTSIMGLMMLAAACGETISVRADGPDADAALAAIVALVEGRFGEELWPVSRRAAGRKRGMRR